MNQPRQPARVPGPQASRKRRSAFSRVFLSLLFIAVTAVLTAGLGGFLGYQAYTIPGPLEAVKVVEIDKGLRTPEIAARLEAQGVISDARVFSAAAFLTGARGRLKAGEYEFAAGASMRDVMNMIVGGKSLVYKLNIPEGWTSEMAVARLRENDVLTGDIAAIPPEGGIMPDTYVFRRGTTRQKLLEDMQAAQNQLLDEIWQKRSGLMVLRTKEETVVLASIVEKETGIAAERPQVASVFMNRLKKGMRLQSDPTIVYGLVGGKGKLGRDLTRADIQKPTPYNTYVIDGLPPGPIANPGRAALEAVVDPPDTEFLYFVADGSGGHAFAKTLEEHNANVAKWRAIDNSAAAALAAETATPPPQPPAAETKAPAPAVPAIAVPAAPQPPATETKATVPAMPEIAAPAAPPETVAAPKPADVAAQTATIEAEEPAVEPPAPDAVADPLPGAEPAAVAAVETKPAEAAKPEAAARLKPGSIIWVENRMIPIPKQKPAQ
ncbi:MAG: endolytic transglycosylase MltG [Hyphomicrobiales bacterium]